MVSGFLNIFTSTRNYEVMKQRNTEVRIACPKCDWAPDGGAYWSCTCGYVWNTFDTGGRCPRCEKQWKKTQCIPHRGGCYSWSFHEDWYRGLDEWLEEEMDAVERLAEESKPK